MSDDVKWFEMRDLKRRSLTRASWIPLCAYDDSRKKGRFGYLGYELEYFAAVSILFPVADCEKALALGWADVSHNWGYKPYVDNDDYFSAGTFRSFTGELVGDYPVLRQSFDAGEPSIWHLTQDIILGLGLYLEEASWLRPEEDYLKVAQIRRSTAGDPLRLEIRTEQLRDFLCAKGCGLLVATYQSREIILDSAPQFGWTDGITQENGDRHRWEGRIIGIHEGGHPYGSKTAVIHAGRKDMDFEVDVPAYGSPGEDEFTHNSWEIEHKGRKLFRVVGWMWRNEWIPPGDASPRVRGDRTEPKVQFTVDATGKTLAGESLGGHHGWLWFKPEVVNALLKRRRGFLKWYTADTGEVGPAPHDGVHFGVNELGFVNVLAKDISLVPEIYQKAWVAYNIAPDGGVCKELLMSQMEAAPADTIAPESLLGAAINHLQKASTQLVGHPLLREHHATEKVLQKIHRFNGHSIEGICFLCKEMTKLIIERIDTNLLKKLDPTADKELGSIKRLEHWLTSEGFDGRQLTAPLVGAYELRVRDVHLPSDEIGESMQLLGLEGIETYQGMAKQAIWNVATSVKTMGDLIIKMHHVSRERSE